MTPTRPGAGRFIGISAAMTALIADIFAPRDGLARSPVADGILRRRAAPVEPRARCEGECGFLRPLSAFSPRRGRRAKVCRDCVNARACVKRSLSSSVRAREKAHAKARIERQRTAGWTDSERRVARETFAARLIRYAREFPAWSSCAVCGADLPRRPGKQPRTCRLGTPCWREWRSRIAKAQRATAPGPCFARPA